MLEFASRTQQGSRVRLAGCESQRIGISHGRGLRRRVAGEIFITIAKEGSTVSGLMDAFATVVSLALQHGVPLKVLCGKLSHMRFEPSGWSGNPQIGYAKSIMDYLLR